MPHRSGKDDDPSPHTNSIDPAELFVGPGTTLELLRTTDWPHTALGPVEDWPAELISAVQLMLPAQSPMLIWWGPQLIQIYNEAYAQLVGNKHPGAVGQPARECWAEAWADLQPFADQVLDSGEPAFAEAKLLVLDRHGYLEETYWTSSYSPIRDATGEVTGVLVVSGDVTARVVGDRRLETVRQLGTVSSADVGGPEETCRAAVTVLSANRQAVPFAAVYLIEPDLSHARLVASYGVREGTAVSPAGTFVLDEHPDLAKAVASGARGLMTGLRETIARDAFERGPIGDERPDAAMLLPVSVSGRGRPIAVAALGVNPYRAIDDVYLTFFQLVARQLRVALSDAIAFEAERLRATALAELDEDKTRFYQNVSHELRTPLTLILGPLRAVLDADETALTPRHRENLQAAHRAALRLRKLVDSLLEFSRVDADEAHTQLQPTDLAGLTSDLASMFRSTVEQAGLEFVVDVSAVREPVDVDPDMWTEIVLNLLSNAVKFTQRGRIAIGLSAVEDRVELRVVDTGIGIAAEHRHTVFDRFVRVEKPGRSAEGAGIGLALVSALAAAHGGDVSVESVLGEGTTFVVSVPKRHTGPAVESDDRPLGVIADAYISEAQSWLPPEAEPETETETAVSLGRLLLVEDNADMRSYLTRLLTDDGWQVVAVATVEAALKVEPPDIVVSDVMLPGASGVDLLRMLRADETLRRIPVILLTARTGADSAAEGLRSGADDYIVKPFEPTELLARVRVHHELARLRDYALNAAENRELNLRKALASNRQIGVALGVVMVQEGLTEERAFDRLREVSQHENRKLRDVADDVVLTGSLARPVKVAEGGDA